MRTQYCFLSVLLLAACASAKTPRTRNETGSVAATPVADPAPQLRGRGVTLAVLPFRNNTGDSKNADLGSTLAELAVMELAGDSRIVLVERARIAEIMSELHLQKTDAIDQETAVRIGRLLGAQLMAFGSIATMDDSAIVTVRVVSVETGQILSGVAKREGSISSLEPAVRTGAHEAVDAAFRVFKAAPSTEGALAGGSQPEAGLAREFESGLPAAREPAHEAIGIVIGVRDYRSKDVPKAEYALNDARAMRLYLVRTLGYQPDNVIYLENPTKAELETVFGSEKKPAGKIIRYIGKRDPKLVDLFVYYSGHGAPGLNDRQAYLVPADANPDYIELNGYPRDLMLTQVAGLGVRSATVVLETCFSGNFDGGSIIRKASPLVLSVEDRKIPANINLFTSSSGDQISSWYPEKGQSLFTYYFLKAVKDSASRLSVLKAGDLIKHVEGDVSDQAGRRYNRDQTPLFFGNRELALAGR